MSLGCAIFRNYFSLSKFSKHQKMHGNEIEIIGRELDSFYITMMEQCITTII